MRAFQNKEVNDKSLTIFSVYEVDFFSYLLLLKTHWRDTLSDIHDQAE